MFDFLPALGSVLSYGTVTATSKKAIGKVGRHKAIVYAYLSLIILLFLGALLLGVGTGFASGLVTEYMAQVVIGALGAIAFYKALDYGKASIISPISKTYVLFVLATSIIFLGEELSSLQITGSMLIVISAAIIALDRWELKLERWMLYLGLSMLCRIYYYTFIKTFVTEWGAFQTALLLETGIALFVIAFHALRGRDLSPPAAGRLRFPVVVGALIFIGSVLYSYSVGAIGAALTAAISAGGPIVNSVASYLIVGEKLDAHKYAAIVLMVIGLAVIFLA